MIIVKFKDWFGQEGILTEGKRDDVFLVYPGVKDEGGNQVVKVISKKAIIDMADKLREKE